MTTKPRVLTGITTTGSPHLGNYVGAIRPAIAASRTRDVESFFFLADYHALVKCHEPERVQRSTLEIAATWLACGLDPGKVFFYRQSDIVEIPELTWLLSCVAAKGLLNRAHAYKAAVDANTTAGEDPDAGVTMGLFNYPVLMAADILLFNAHEVPVGRDQIQHIEMARDIGQRFNHLFGREYFTLPEARVDDSTAILPGLDGRKMSKSYNNTIPLWLSAKQLRQAILGIVTNSLEPGQPKDPDSSHIFTIYQAFASADETAAFRQALLDGLGWGDAKQRLFERIDAELAEARTRYEALMAEPERIEQILRAGASRARERSAPFMAQLRNAVGLRSLAQGVAGPAKPAKKKAPSGARFVTYREKSGAFHFKLVGADGTAVLVSRAFGAPDVARAAQDALLEVGAQELAAHALAGAAHDGGFRFVLRSADGTEIAYGALHAAAADSRAALERALAELDGVRAAKLAAD